MDETPRSTTRPATHVRFPRRLGWGRIAAISTVMALIGACLGSTAPPASAAPPPETAWGVRGRSASQLNLEWTVRDIEHVGSSVFVAGRFTQVVAPDGRTFAQASLAAFDRASGAWKDGFRPVFDGPVHSITRSADGDRLFVGGEFTTINGVPTGNVAAIDPITGTVIDDFRAPAQATTGGRNIVHALEIAGNQLYIGGEFSGVNGVGQNHLVRVSASTGQVDASFTPRIQLGSVMAVEPAADGQRVFVGGQFEQVDDDPELRNFAALGATGAPLPQRRFDQRPFAEAPLVFDIEEAAGRVFIASQSNVLTIVDARTLELDRVYGPDPANLFQPGAFKSGDFQALAVGGASVYAGSHIRWIGQPAPTLGNGTHDSKTGVTSPVNVLSRYELDGDHDTSFLPLELAGGIWAVDALPEGCVWFGGNRLDVGSKADWNLGRICDPAMRTTIALSRSVDDLINAGDYRSDDGDTLRLYRAFFDRDPDVVGAQYWLNESRQGVDYDDMAWSFANSAEFAQTYGGVTNDRFLDIVYRNVLGRDPDPSGFAYWSAEMRRGLPRHLVVRWVAASAEFIAKRPYSRIN